MKTMAVHAEAVEILVHKAHFEPEVALGVAEAIEVSINLTQVVTVPVLDARLQELRHDIKSDFAEVRADMATMRTEMVSQFEKMRAETASEFGRMRADMADQIGKVRVETANEFSKVRVEMAAGFGQVASEFSRVRVEMATGFGQVAGEFGKVRTETQAVKADLMRWVLLTLVSSAAISAVVRGFMN
jgi:alpha-glucosidase (family GH31 glycosyl hydrolase)